MRIKTEQIMCMRPTGKTYQVDLFEFHELDEAAQDRVVDEYEREYMDTVSYDFANYNEHEIWECVRDLERQTGCKWHYNRWYSCDFDVEGEAFTTYEPERVDIATDNGYYASFDICKAWNKHARKLNGLATQYEHVTQLLDNVYPYWGPHYTTVDENIAFNSRLEDLQGSLFDMYAAELDRACGDVANAIQYLLQTEWDYVTSREYIRARFEDLETGYECRTIDDAGRVYYHDTRAWFTADGELYERANVNHECISIVTAA